MSGERAKVLRKTMTASEARLWNSIRRSQLGGRFRRQLAIGFYIADFACLKPKLVIEIDDTSHGRRQEDDRTAYIQSRGFKILRFTNRAIAFELYWVTETIKEWVALLKEGIDPEG
jgi:very-short-patch-repair endonuclease